MSIRNGLISVRESKYQTCFQNSTFPQTKKVYKKDLNN